MFSKRIRNWILFLGCLFFYTSVSASTEELFSWKLVNSDGKEISDIEIDSLNYIQINQFFKEWINEQSKPVNLHINGLQLETVVLRPFNSNQYAFYIDRKLIDNEFWSLLRKRTADKDWFEREVTVTFGANGQVAAKAVHQPLHIVMAGMWRLSFAFGILVILSLIFYFACQNSNVLRHGKPPDDGGKPPLSLAGSQMALWLFIIIASFLFIWIITGDLSSINDTAMILIGISSATFVGAAVIESSDHSGTPVPALQAIGPAAKTLSRKKTKTALLQLLSDNDGVSLHRFQIFSWTLVLTAMFGFEVFKYLKMPDFSATLLGVLGISSGTYLGFKFPELKSQDSSQQSN